MLVGCLVWKPFFSIVVWGCRVGSSFSNGAIYLSNKFTIAIHRHCLLTSVARETRWIKMHFQSSTYGVHLCFGLRLVSSSALIEDQKTRLRAPSIVVLPDIAWCEVPKHPESSSFDHLEDWGLNISAFFMSAVYGGCRILRRRHGLLDEFFLFRCLFGRPGISSITGHN